MSQRQIADAITLSRKLVQFYNANTAGTPIKKFADRATAERRCALLAEELEAEGFDDGDVIYALGEGVRLEKDGDAPVGDDKPVNVKQAIAAALEKSGVEPTWAGHTHCPHCGIHLGNGVTTYDDLRSNKNHDIDVKAMTREYMCLACNGNFGPEIVRTAKKATAPTGKSRPAMSASLKIDRQIKDETTGIIYKNACQVWKAGLVTAAQGDRLSAALYGAAKTGNRLTSLTIGNHVFTLAVK